MDCFFFYVCFIYCLSCKKTIQELLFIIKACSFSVTGVVCLLTVSFVTCCTRTHKRTDNTVYSSVFCRQMVSAHHRIRWRFKIDIDLKAINTQRSNSLYLYLYNQNTVYPYCFFYLV